MKPEDIAKDSEHSQQAAFFCWASMVEQRKSMPELQWMFAIPNGGSRGDSKKSAAIRGGALKAEGVKSGVADICLPVRKHWPKGTGWFSGLYIEMKRADGTPGDFSEAQLDFCMFVSQQGYAWYPAFGWREAVHIVESYFKIVTPLLSLNQSKVFSRLYA